MELSKFEILGFQHTEALATPNVSKAIHKEKNGAKVHDLDWVYDQGKVAGIHVKAANTNRTFIVPLSLIAQIEVTLKPTGPLSSKKAA